MAYKRKRLVNAIEAAAMGALRKRQKKATSKAVAAVVKAAKASSRTRTKTTKKPRPGSNMVFDNQGKAKIRSKKAHVINRDLKGKAKKFADKVTKAIAHTNHYGEYTYIGGTQLRQIIIGRYGVYYGDYNGRDIVLGNFQAYQDAASICWHDKPLRNNFRDNVGNLNNNQTFSVMSETLNMFFKSTSSHVVNIEMYEFIAKHDQETSPTSFIEDSFDDFVNRYSDLNGADPSTFGWEMNGVCARHLTAVYPHYDIKVHRFKLEPGFSTSKSFMKKGKRVEMSKHVDLNERLYPYNKGSSVFKFRVLNDVTVSSSTSPTVPFVRHWPSNWRGGVALEYHRVIRVAPLISNNHSNLDNRPVIAIGYHQPPIVTGEADQQVVVENPIVAATAD